MGKNSLQLHASLVSILRRLSVTDRASLTDQKFDELLRVVSNILREQEEYNNLVQHSLSTASDELAEFYSKLASSSKMASLGEMAGGVAHEVNNPLAIIIGKTQQLMGYLSKESFSKEKILEGLKLIEKQSFRIMRIVNQLMTYSRDGSKDQFQKTSLQEVILDTVEMCRPRCQGQGIELIVPSINCDIQFYSRPVQISQALLNLINNAYDSLEFNQPGDQLKWIRIDVEATGTEISLSVLDSGPGIPLALEGKVMQPFFTTKPVGRGTGLGMSLTSAIAMDHRGSLSIDRMRGHSCVVFRFARNLMLPLPTGT